MFSNNIYLNGVLMKKYLAIVLALSAFANQSAMADRYEVFVTGSTHVSPSQTSLSNLMQKDIVVDTEQKSLYLQLASPCKPHMLCSQMIHALKMNLTQFVTQNDQVTQVKAEINNMTVEMNLNADHAMDITITDSAGCKTIHSDFVGSPAKPESNSPYL